MVEALLNHGLLAGNLRRDGGFDPWDNQTAPSVVERIRREWQALGHDPSIDDIAWFYFPR